MKSPSSKYGLHESMGYWVNRLASEMHDSFDRAASPLGVTAAQWAVLISLYHGDAKTPGELADYIHINGAAVTRLLDRLERKGLVERRAHESDRRALAIVLTEAGRKLTPKVVSVSRNANESFLQRLAPKEQTQFLKLVRKMTKSDTG